MRTPLTGDGIEAQIGALYGLPRSELLEHWRKLTKAAPPKGISRALLIRAVAYGIQVKYYGALRPTVIRRLHKLKGGALAEAWREGRARSKLRPGSRLIREWNGSAHVVEVVEGGFVWNSDKYRSLSAIARAITGARWSGPRFFGLTSDSSS